MTSILHVENVSVYFPTPSGPQYALRDINFEIRKGEIMGVVGETGSGKTVLALSILNLVAPGVISSGSIYYKGRDIVTLGRKELSTLRGKDISMIFPDPATCFDPLFTVGQQISDTLRTHENLSKKEAEEKAIHLLEMVGIPSPQRRLNDYPHQFSGGMIQRAMIAAAISSNPELIIADNPTQALDVTVQAQILELLIDLKERLGTSILFISHNLGVISEIVHDVMVLYGGRLVEKGEKSRVLHHPGHPYTRALIESIPKMTGERVGRLKTVSGRPSKDGQGCSFRLNCPIAVPQCGDTPPLQALQPRHEIACWNATAAAVGGAES